MMVHHLDEKMNENDVSDFCLGIRLWWLSLKLVAGLENMHDRSYFVR
jgi:hypothetical protein